MLAAAGGVVYTEPEADHRLPAVLRFVVLFKPLFCVLLRVDGEAVCRGRRGDGRTLHPQAADPVDDGPHGKSDDAGKIALSLPGKVKDRAVYVGERDAALIPRIDRDDLVKRPIKRHVVPCVDAGLSGILHRREEVRRGVPVGRQPYHRAVQRDHLPEERERIRHVLSERTEPERVRESRERNRTDVALGQAGMQHLIQVAGDQERRTPRGGRLDGIGNAVPHDRRPDKVVDDREAVL